MTYRKIILAVGSNLLLILVLIPLAMAHVKAKETNPESGAVLTEAPTVISIQFTGPAKLVSLELTGSNVELVKIDVSEATSVDGLVTVQIPPLSPDAYTVSWRALSIDGHPAKGSFTFEISTPDSS